MDYICSNLNNGEFKISLINNYYEENLCKRKYILLTSTKNKQTSYFGTYDENLTIKNNSQYSLTFSMLKNNNNIENPLFPLIVENRRLRLELENNKIIDFIITSKTPKITKNNVEYSVTCQDQFSFDLSKKNILISYSELALPINEHAENILSISKLDDSYEIEHKLSTSEYERFPNMLVTTLVDNADETRTSLEIKDSTPYTAFIKLCEQYNALIDVSYPLKDNDKTVIYFNNLDTIPYKGLSLKPEVNLSNFSFSTKTDNFCSILRVSGGEDSSGNQVSLLPNLPFKVKDYFLKNMEVEDFFKKSSNEWFNDFNNTYIVDSYGEGQNTITKEEKIECNNFFTALSSVVKSGGNILYDFDYYKNNGLMSKETYDQLENFMSYEMRNASIKILTYTTQYNLLYADYINKKYKEEEYVTYMAAIQELNFSYYKDYYKSEKENEKNILMEKIRMNNGKHDDFLNNLITMWTSNDKSVLDNDKTGYDVKYPEIIACLFGRDYINDPEDYEKITSAINSNNYDLTQLNLKEKLIYDLYTAQKLYEDYDKKIGYIKKKTEIDLDNPNATIPETEMGVYADYAYYKSLKEEQYPYIDDVDNNLIKIGYYLTYLIVIGSSDEKFKEYLTHIVEYVYGKGEKANKIISYVLSENSGLGLTNYIQDNQNLKLETLSSLVSSSTNYGTPLKEKVEKLEEEKDNLWKELYNRYGDYIVESSYNNSEQLSSDGLYLAAKKQLTTYSSPTQSYSSTIIDINSIDGCINDNVNLGDIVYLYNKDISNKFNNTVIIKTYYDDYLYHIDLVSEKTTKKDTNSISTYYLDYSVKNIEEINKKYMNIYIKLDSLYDANAFIQRGHDLYYKYNNEYKKIDIISKTIDFIADPIPLQVTGISKKLRDSTTTLTISTNRITNNILGKMLRGIK